MFRNSGLAIFAFAAMGLIALGVAAAGVFHPLSMLIKARGYAPADATVVFTETRDRPAGRNRTIRYFYVEYDYTVNGASFRSSRCTVSDPESISERSLGYWRSRCGVNTTIPIWYDPLDPAQSLVDRRPTDQFGFIALGFIWLSGMAVVSILDAVDAIVWRARRLPGGVFIRPQVAGAILHIPQMSPLAIGSGVTGVSGCFFAIIWMFLQLNKSQPFLVWWPLALVGGLTTASGIMGFVWERYLARSGKRDLIIDEAMRTVTAPSGPRGRGPQTIEFQAITDVDVVIWDHEVRTQYGSTKVYTYVPTIVYRSKLGGWRNAHLVEWRDEGKALALASWLRKRLNTTESYQSRQTLE